jgi:hypothetical protein
VAVLVGIWAIALGVYFIAADVQFLGREWNRPRPGKSQAEAGAELSRLADS